MSDGATQSDPATGGSAEVGGTAAEAEEAAAAEAAAAAAAAAGQMISVAVCAAFASRLRTSAASRPPLGSISAPCLTGARVAEGLLAELLDGVVVEDLSVLDDAVVAHGGVRVERDVGEDDRLGQRLLDHPHRARHDPLRVVRLLAAVRLELVLNLREEDEGADAVLPRVLRLGEHRWERVPLAARHRRDLRVLRHVVDEERIHKIGRRQRRLAHHPPDGGALAVAPRPRALIDERPAARRAREDCSGAMERVTGASRSETTAGWAGMHLPREL